MFEWLSAGLKRLQTLLYMHPVRKELKFGKGFHIGRHTRLWAPISIWLKKACHIAVSHELIHQYVIENKAYVGDLYSHLRRQKQRRKRYGRYSRHGQLLDWISIDESPAAVDLRCRIGNWELDNIIGKGYKQAIVSLTERKSRYTLTQKVKRKKTSCVSKAIISLLSTISDQVHTLNSYNRKEFADHKNIADKLNAKFFIAHPYTSWVRSLNENTNGLICQQFQKSRDFTTINQVEINKITDKLNKRPRKCLSIKTPNQVFLGINPSVALAS
ncbi:MAG: IS30 family transposase [Candidatus Thiodiazotropha endolucinida]